MRLKSDPNLYYFVETGNYLMVYVDDLVRMGPDRETLFKKIEKNVLPKKTGSLTEGATAKFLGRKVRMREGTIELFVNPDYVVDVLGEHGLKDAKPVVSPGRLTVTTPDVVSALSTRR